MTMQDLLNFLLAFALICGYFIFAKKYVVLYNKRKEDGFEAKYGKEFRRYRMYTWVLVIAFIICALIFTFIIPE